MEGNEFERGRLSKSVTRETVIGQCSKAKNVVTGNSMFKANNTHRSKRARQWNEKEGELCAYSLEGVSDRVSEEVERLTNYIDREVNTLTRCNLKGFKRVVSRLSDEKLTVIEEMGLTATYM